MSLDYDIDNNHDTYMLRRTYDNMLVECIKDDSKSEDLKLCPLNCTNISIISQDLLSVPNIVDLFKNVKLIGRICASDDTRLQSYDKLSVIEIRVMLALFIDPEIIKKYIYANLKNPRDKLSRFISRVSWKKNSIVLVHIPELINDSLENPLDHFCYFHTADLENFLRIYLKYLIKQKVIHESYYSYIRQMLQVIKMKDNTECEGCIEFFY